MGPSSRIEGLSAPMKSVSRNIATEGILNGLQLDLGRMGGKFVLIVTYTYLFVFSLFK